MSGWIEEAVSPVQAFSALICGIYYAWLKIIKAIVGMGSRQKEWINIRTPCHSWRKGGIDFIGNLVSAACETLRVALECIHLLH